MMKIKLDDFATKPTKGHFFDAGWDLYNPAKIQIEPRSSVLIDTGVHMAIPEGYVGFIKSRSSMATKRNLMADMGVIDCGYTGPIKIRIYNQTDRWQEILAGDRICQLIVLKIDLDDLEVVDDLEATERGDGGFGSTGR